MPTLWDVRAKLYDVFEASDLRRGACKSGLFSRMAGRVLFVGLGTGKDIHHFPPGIEIVAMDISDEMLRRCRSRQKAYPGVLRLVRADALSLCFCDESFDTVVTSCAMCSVDDPVLALRELHRVLRPAGELLMFEHVRSKNPILGAVLDLMTLATRGGGTKMNRDTLGNVVRAGFRIVQVDSVFLDIILTVRAVKAAEATAPVNFEQQSARVLYL